MHRIETMHTSISNTTTSVALTLDACSGGYDESLIALLVKLQIPATVFLTQRWMDKHPQGPGAESLADVEREVLGGAQAIQKATGQKPLWFRGAGARYDEASLALIKRLGFHVAGYSVNADDGATASAEVVSRRVQAAKPGDIILAHMNRPTSGTAQGLKQALPLLQAQGVRFVHMSQVATVSALSATQQRKSLPEPARREP
jgi:peptidoglycan/xylan/chitin deacetylase (PgdA/CDA1 family)